LIGAALSVVVPDDSDVGFLVGVVGVPVGGEVGGDVRDVVAVVAEAWRDRAVRVAGGDQIPAGAASCSRCSFAIVERLPEILGGGDVHVDRRGRLEVDPGELVLGQL